MRTQNRDSVLLLLKCSFRIFPFSGVEDCWDLEEDVRTGFVTDGFLTAVDMCSLSAVVLFLSFTGVWCHDCNLTTPYFESRNFHHVLRWNEVDIPGEVVLYSVQYHMYGVPYKAAAWCQNISVPVCDLTPVIMVTDVTSRYYVKVTAAGRCVGKVPFNPYEQTLLEAPQLFVSQNETVINVTVSPPMGPENRSIQNISCQGECQHPMTFTVNLTRPKFAAGRVFTSTIGSVLVWPMEADTEYCGDAVYSLTHPSSPRQSDKASFCVPVTGHNSWFHILLFPVLLAVVLLSVLPMILYQQSVNRKPLLPNSLTFPEEKSFTFGFKMLSKNNTLPFCPIAQDVISKVQLCSGFIGNLPVPHLQSSVIPEGSKVTSNGTGYAPQGDGMLSGDQEASSGGHSVSYSMIVGLHTPEETSEKKHSSSEISNPLVWTGEHRNISSEPLVIPVIPEANGLLQFIFPTDSESESPSEGLSLFGERTPLLTDLVVEDSGRNSKILYPNLTSGYRQNWIPGMPLEGREDQKPYALRTGHLQESREAQEETTEGEDGINVGLSFLDRWMLNMEG